MKTWGGKAMTNRVKKECEKYVIEHLDEIKYELFTEIVQDDFRQAEAVMLYALSLHGFGRQRLQRFHEWFKSMTELPTFNGKPFTCQDCMKYISDKYRIDFESVNVAYESKEHYERK